MKSISLVIPSHNEEKNIVPVYKDLKKIIDNSTNYKYQIIFVDDGSMDNTVEEIKKIMKIDKNVTLLEFSRNFGKELATTAGLHNATGDAVICIDCDLQHPPHHIPSFIKMWEDGYDVVVGVRKNNASDSVIKKFGSYAYYKIMNKLSKTKITPKATDFRLIDRQVVDYFKEFSEHNRMTRGLIDWLGFNRGYVYFDVPDRLHGKATYDLPKLISLAVESFISYSFAPLKLAAYLGTFIMMVASVLGIVMILDKFFLENVYFNFSGPAMLAVMILFLIGLVLVCIGLLSFYVGHIYHNVQNRHLYVIKRSR